MEYKEEGIGITLEHILHANAHWLLSHLALIYAVIYQGTLSSFINKSIVVLL